MLDLSPETETLARNLAEARQVSVDVVIRDALEAQTTTGPARLTSAPDLTTDDLATRRVAALRKYADEIAKLPILDTRSVKEITDDLNPL